MAQVSHYFGAGKTLDEARRPLIITCEDIKVGLYACAEYEFSIASSERPGANPYDPLNVFDDIVDLSTKVDYVVVLYHGSKEFYRYPIPYVQDRCRKMIDKGASIVLCQHSHCIGAKERWKEGEILYGQGNFLFNRRDDEYRHSGLLVEISFESDGYNVEYIPIVRNEIGISEPSESEKKMIVSEFEKRSEECKSAEFIEDMYTKFAMSKLEYYNSSILPDNFVFKVLKRLLGNKRLSRSSTTNKAQLLNVLRCEAHRDLFIRAIVEENSFDKFD